MKFGTWGVVRDCFFAKAALKMMGFVEFFSENCAAKYF